MKKLKIIFAGTADFSAAHLNILLTSSHDVIAVISQPDCSSGRGQKITFSPVKRLSINNKIPIFQPTNLHDEIFQNKLLKFNADIMIVVSYGKLIPKKILTMFPKGCINIHASLLPRWRGATPIQSSILNGDKKTGISIINMDDKIDTGKIIYSISCDISSQDTTKSLSLKLMKIGMQALLEVLEKITNNTIIEKKQNEKNAIVSKKIYKKDALLNWNLKAEKLERLIRAFIPWPVCYFLLKNEPIRIWQATVIPIIKKTNFSVGEIIVYNNNGIQVNTSYQILNIEKIQFPGKKIIDVKNIPFSKKKIFQIGTII
ncbi:methionyl-tRNA formyltransferase [Buchnera aphidicola (Hyperomyzus lactucae)]|uniref:Methionyl-tRNA formyltransferase n=1 Tax=Buchnera aphidicola (Hyperomyzus lactucae) TaxID=1241860 RepID=A0A4D6Y453_9GAMM|nr:methionyl-tRNA formyltransferase [Buchnera aphidicola]QCI21204.1 methionyl-tRNA formyltransferase [Buchnera aphidicola (Hyperomyzus lactucae)]